VAPGRHGETGNSDAEDVGRRHSYLINSGHRWSDIVDRLQIGWNQSDMRDIGYSIEYGEYAAHGDCALFEDPERYESPEQRQLLVTN
jgi:hypothetical protein